FLFLVPTIRRGRRRSRLLNRHWRAGGGRCGRGPIRWAATLRDASRWRRRIQCANEPVGTISDHGDAEQRNRPTTQRDDDQHHDQDFDWIAQRVLIPLLLHLLRSVAHPAPVRRWHWRRQFRCGALWVAGLRVTMPRRM